MFKICSVRFAYTKKLGNQFTAELDIGPFSRFNPIRVFTTYTHRLSD